jgi:hypothetical protein
MILKRKGEMLKSPSSYVDIYTHKNSVETKAGNELFTELNSDESFKFYKEKLGARHEIKRYENARDILNKIYQKSINSLAGNQPTFLQKSHLSDQYQKEKEREDDLIQNLVSTEPAKIEDLERFMQKKDSRPDINTNIGASIPYDILGKSQEVSPPSFAEAIEEEPSGRAPAIDPETDPELEEPERIVREITGTTAEDEAGLGGAGEEKKDDEEDEGEQLIKETPVDIDELRKQRDRVGQEERVDLKADPPMSAMALTDAKPVVGERNMRPTLFREEGDTVKLSRRQEQENRMFYENFTWIDAGFGNGNIQRLPNEMYAGRDVANNRLYDAQVKNQILKYSGDLFVGNQQYRKKYDISARTRRLVKTPMHSTVQHHQQFIRDSSLPAGAGRKHQMARDNPSWMPEKNVNSRVGHLYYPDVVDGNRV